MNNNYLEILTSNDIDSMLITNKYDVSYFSDFTGKDSYILFTLNKKYFIADPRFIEQAQKECKGFEIILLDEKKPLGLATKITEILKNNNCKKIGIDTLYIPLKMYDDFIISFDNIEIVKLQGITKKIRMKKTKEEIDIIQKACEITDRSYYRILEILSESMSEKDIEIELGYLIKREGGADYSFDPIIASGKRTSIPYNIPDHNVKIRSGDFVLLNYGAKYKGYTSTIARTVVMDHASNEQKKMYKEFLGVYKYLLNSISDGVMFKEYYKGYLSFIEKSKYKEFYLRSIGNGLGLNSIEGYIITPYSDGKFCKDEVYSIGTSLVIPNVGGIRLEDVILVKEDGIIQLTKSPKELLFI